MNKKFIKEVKRLIKEAKVSCEEAVSEDSPYELSPELWSLVCKEFGYYDHETDRVIKDSSND